MEAYRSAATVPAMRTVVCKSPVPTTMVGIVTSVAVLSLAVDRVFRYQAAPAATSTTTARKIPDKVRRRVGSTGRGTISGPGTGAEPGIRSGPGAGALLKYDCIGRTVQERTFAYLQRLAGPSQNWLFFKVLAARIVQPHLEVLSTVGKASVLSLEEQCQHR